MSHPRLSAEALQAMYAHARQEYPKECCGIVFGPRASEAADEARACRNNQDDLHAADPATYTRDARTAYNLEPRDLFALQKSLRGERPAKIIYHSHVDVARAPTSAPPTRRRRSSRASRPTRWSTW